MLPTQAIDLAKNTARTCGGFLLGLRVESVADEGLDWVIGLSWLEPQAKIPMMGLFPWLRRKVFGPPPMERVHRVFYVSNDGSVRMSPLDEP